MKGLVLQDHTLHCVEHTPFNVELHNNQYLQYYYQQKHEHATTTPDNITNAQVVTSYIGLCGSDRQKIFGESTISYLGHEIVGIDRNTNSPVVINPNITCEICEYCTIGSENLCNSELALGTSIDGAMYGEIVVPYSNVIKINNLRAEYIYSDPLAVIIHGVNLAQSIKEPVLILGNGTLAKLLAYYLEQLNIDFCTVPYQKIISELENNNISRRYRTIFECIGYDQDYSLKYALLAGLPLAQLIVFGVFSNQYYSSFCLRNFFEFEFKIAGVRSFQKNDFLSAVHYIDKNINFFENLKHSIYKISDINNINDSLRFEHKKLIVDFNSEA